MQTSGFDFVKMEGGVSCSTEGSALSCFFWLNFSHVLLALLQCFSFEKFFYSLKKGEER